MKDFFGTDIEYKEIKKETEKSEILSFILNEGEADKSIIEKQVKSAKSNIVYIPYEGAKIIGFVSLAIGNEEAEISYAEILKEYRRHGYGTELMGLCGDYCRKNKIKQLKAKIYLPDKHKISDFFASAGFKKTEEEDKGTFYSMARYFDEIQRMKKGGKKPKGIWPFKFLKS